ncbi:MAG: membrane-bound lytic murein transglycosylase MltF [Gammaproteobacteria bacterium]|nr:MAG: membrane-bound lytic murein transglycosylase MltF [Gammaproteobacteria bacterium]
MRSMARFLTRFTLLALLTLQLGCQPAENSLEAIKQRGELRIATRISPTTYYIAGSGPAGLEYDLAKLFAERLGVRLSVIAVDDMDRLFRLLADGSVDLLAAGLAITPQRTRRLKFSVPYQNVSVKLVFKQGKFWPRNFDQLDGQLYVLARSSHSELLRRAKSAHPWLSWHETTQYDIADLVQMVLDESIDYMLIDSNDLALHRRYHPDLVVAFTVAEKQPLAWAFRRDIDDSLPRAVGDFFHELKENGTLSQLIEQYYGHLDDFDYVGTKAFLATARQVLPKYKPLFQQAAHENGLDWQLLAAISYQESHWNPRAKSPTGVRGMMMLTLPTARQYGVKSRLNPAENILAGARYFSSIKRRLPKRIAEPDRTWLALAAYNVGLGHLEDARVLTQRFGKNPDKWVDVKAFLPLLSQKRYYKTVKHGFARGYEPVQYVDNIRRYYEILQWLSQQPLQTDDGPMPDTEE